MRHAPPDRGDVQLGPKLDLLKLVPLLDDLNDAELLQISAFFSVITLRTGQTLYTEGAEANSACLVVDGELDAFAKLPGGGETMVGTIAPGAIIGEMALLEDGRRTASVRARTDAKTLEISGAFFQALLEQMDLPAHKVLRRVIRGLAGRLSDVRYRIVEQMERRIADRAYQPARETLQAGAGEVVVDCFNFRKFLPLLPFFRAFHDADIARLLSMGKVVTKPKQALLFDEGDRANSAYLVLRGCIDRGVWRRGRVRISLTGPGRICGASEILSERDRGSSAAALTDSLLLELDQSAFEDLFCGDATECLKFQNAIGIDQINDLKSANNLLALLTNLEHIRHNPRLTSVS